LTEGDGIGQFVDGQVLTWMPKADLGLAARSSPGIRQSGSSKLATWSVAWTARCRRTTARTDPILLFAPAILPPEQCDDQCAAGTRAQCQIAELDGGGRRQWMPVFVVILQHPVRTRSVPARRPSSDKCGCLIMLRRVSLDLRPGVAAFTEGRRDAIDGRAEQDRVASPGIDHEHNPCSQGDREAVGTAGSIGDPVGPVGRRSGLMASLSPTAKARVQSP
jgi:hypothetical protein